MTDFLLIPHYFYKSLFLLIFFYLIPPCFRPNSRQFGKVHIFFVFRQLRRSKSARFCPLLPVFSHHEQKTGRLRGARHLLDGKDGLTHIAVFISFFAIFACFLPVFGFFYLFFFSMNHVISAKNLPPHHPTQAPLTNGGRSKYRYFFMSRTFQAIQPKREGVLMDRKPMVVNGAIKIRGLF